MRRKTVLLALCKGVEISEAAAFVDVLGWSEEHGSEPVEVVTAGLRPEIRCSFGLILRPQLLLPDVKAGGYDALAVPGGFETHGFYEDAFSGDLLELIRDFHREEKPIASVCVGALALGKSGILCGRRATTYHLGQGRRRRQLAEMGANVQDERIVRDGNLVSSTSPETAMDVAFLLLEILTGRENAQLVRAEMGFGPLSS